MEDTADDRAEEDPDLGKYAVGNAPGVKSGFGFNADMHENGFGFSNCEGFRMPAIDVRRGFAGPASESLQGRNPREGLWGFEGLV